MKLVKKKVLDIVSYQYLPFVSGGQKNIGFFLEYLGELTSLHVVGTTDNISSYVKNYTFHPSLIKSRIRYIDITNIFRISNIIKINQIDTVIIEHPYIGWLGIILKKITGVQLIIRTHNIEYERFRSIGKWWWRVLKIYEIWILKKADKIFCISDEDKSWMIEKIGISEKKCFTIPYGVIQSEHPKDKQKCKDIVTKKHGLNPNNKLLFFNGLLDYSPNTDAVLDIINKINPLLLTTGLEYNILIAGKNLPKELEELKKWNKEHVFYVGFVEDIDQYTKAADIFLNPVNTGGGVKTKMIEAIGLGATVIATENGAIGVDKEACGEKIKIVKNDGWEEFVNQIKIATNEEKITPVEFYKKYTWTEIISNAAGEM